MTGSRSPASRPLKVCHIAATTEGATWLFEQLRELRDRHGCEVAAVLNGERGSLVDRLRSAGISVQVAEFDFTSTTKLLALPRMVARLARHLRDQQFDVVQTHLFHSMVVGRLAAWVAGVPVRCSMIAGPFHLEAYTPRWIDRLTCWADTTIIASCEYTRRLYRAMGVAGERCALIYYGPDETRFNPASTEAADLRREFGWPAGTPLIGLVAYFYGELPVSRWIPPVAQGRSVKSQEDLIRAAPFVLRDCPEARFLLIGSAWDDGGRAYMRRMQELAADLGIASHVIFAGYRTDIPRILRGLDIAVQCSVSENLGGTIESLLMECPTVVTRVGGMTDSVVDGETGVVVEPSDPRSLADGILRLLRDPVAARRCATTGRRRMLERFTLRRTAEELAALYRREHEAPRAAQRRLPLAVRGAVAWSLGVLIAMRIRLVDAWILPRWDQGWRPWRANALSLRARFTLRRTADELARFTAVNTKHREPVSAVCRRGARRGRMLPRRADRDAHSLGRGLDPAATPPGMAPLANKRIDVAANAHVALSFLRLRWAPRSELWASTAHQGFARSFARHACSPYSPTASR